MAQIVEAKTGYVKEDDDEMYNFNAWRPLQGKWHEQPCTEKSESEHSTDEEAMSKQPSIRTQETDSSWQAHDDDVTAVYGPAPGRGHRGERHRQRGDRKGDGKGDEGKCHKGISKNPQRSEQRKFGDQCNWCWRSGCGGARHRKAWRW